MVSILAWLLAAATLVGGQFYGLWSKSHWTPLGLARLELFAVVSAVSAAVLIAWRPRLLVPAGGALMLLLALGAVGPLAVFAAAWCVVSSWALGRLLFRGIEEPAVATTLGLAVWIVLFSWLVRWPINTVALWWVLTAAPVAWAIGRRLPVPRIELPADDRQSAVPAALLMAALAAHCLQAIKPDVSADALAMHLVIPERIAFFHRWAFDVTEFSWSAMAMGGDWAFSIAFLLGGEAAARLLNLSALLLMVALLARHAGWLPAALWASTPLAGLVTGSLFVENIWALLLLAAFLLASGPRPAPWAVALLAGAAAQCKLMAVPLAVPILGIALWRARCWWPSLLFACTAPHPYVESLIRTGNPLFPYFNAWFPSPFFPTTQNLTDIRWREALSWRTLWDATFHTPRFNEGAAGGFGFQWLILLPPAIYAAWREQSLAVRLAVALGLFEAVVVLLGQPYIRYLYAALLLWSLAFGLVAQSRPVLRWLMALLVPLNLFFFAASGWYHRDFWLKPFAGANEVSRYVAEGAPLRSLVDFANHAHAGKSVAFLARDEAAGLRARAYVNSWRGGLFAAALSNVQTVDDALRLLQKHDIRLWIGHVVESPRLFSKVAIWELARTHSDERHRSGQWALYELLPQPRSQESVVMGPGVWDELNTAAHFDGPWYRDLQFSEAHDGTLQYCNQSGCSADFTFDGRAVTILFTAADNRGQAQILLDGRPTGVLDEYAPTVQWRQRYRVEAPSAGRHRLTVRVLGFRQAKSRGEFVDVDAWEVQ